MSAPPTTPEKKSFKPRSLKLSDVNQAEVYAVMEKKYLITKSALDEMAAGYSSAHSLIVSAIAAVAGVLWGFWYQCSTEPHKRYYLDFAIISTAVGLFSVYRLVDAYRRANEKKNNLYDTAVRIHPPPD